MSSNPSSGSLFRRVLAISALISGLVVGAPFILGYGVAFGGYIPYGVVCKEKDDLFSGTVKASNYIVFLMNRGCDFNDAISDILRNDLDIPKYIDLDRIIKLLNGKLPLSSATNLEILFADMARSKIRTFKWPKNKPTCPQDDSLCGIQYPWVHDLVEDLFILIGSLYSGYFLSTFSTCVFNGASLLVAFSNLGTVFRMTLFLIYAAALLYVIPFAVKYVLRKVAAGFSEGR